MNGGASFVWSNATREGEWREREVERERERGRVEGRERCTCSLSWVYISGCQNHSVRTQNTSRWGLCSRLPSTKPPPESTLPLGGFWGGDGGTQTSKHGRVPCSARSADNFLTLACIFDHLLFHQHKNLRILCTVQYARRSTGRYKIFSNFSTT